jgi:hypothetical protein
MQRQADEVFGTNSSEPVEHMADCAAQVANPGGYLGYGGRCTATQLRDAAYTLGIAPGTPYSSVVLAPRRLAIALAACAVGFALVAALLLARLRNRARRKYRAAAAAVAGPFENVTGEAAAADVPQAATTRSSG